MVLPLLAAVAPFAPIIGGVIGALGSLFAPKPKPVKNSIDLMGLRKDAEAAGFNPLTIIRGGGLAGYGVTPAAPDMRLSNALMTFGSGVAQFQYDPYGQAKSLAELRLAEAQIQSLGRSGATANTSLSVPTASGASTQGTGWTFAGMNFEASPLFSDAQDVENRHGELMSNIWGFFTAPADVGMAHGKWLGAKVFEIEQALKGWAYQPPSGPKQPAFQDDAFGFGNPRFGQ